MAPGGMDSLSIYFPVHCPQLSRGPLPMSLGKALLSARFLLLTLWDAETFLSLFVSVRRTHTMGPSLYMGELTLEWWWYAYLFREAGPPTAFSTLGGHVMIVYSSVVAKLESVPVTLAVQFSLRAQPSSSQSLPALSLLGGQAGRTGWLLSPHLQLPSFRGRKATTQWICCS